MKHIIALQFFFICELSYSQNFKISKIVVDATTKLPLENVIIFNERDNSISNADGKFIFVSQKNEINLKLLGYEEFKTTFDKLKSLKDTVFMQSKAIQLQEVVVSNDSSFMMKFFEKNKDNYLENYSINFFLRSTLKKENRTYTLQDMSAKRNQNTSNKKKTSIEILNMRKVKLLEKVDVADFEIPNFNRVFNIFALRFENCTFTEVPFNDSNFKKVLFQSKERDSKGQIWKGYLIVNRDDFAAVEYYLIWVSDSEKMPYGKLTNEKGQHRTVQWTKLVQFAKDLTSNKYYPSNLKQQTKIEVLMDGKTLYYDFNMEYFTTNNPSNEKVKSNFSADEDIFKAKFPYSKDFWDNQNQLPLTQEMELFLKSVNEKKGKTKEFEVIGNF